LAQGSYLISTDSALEFSLLFCEILTNITGLKSYQYLGRIYRI